MPTRKKRAIRAEDLYDFQLISSPRLSPDGKNVVYLVQRVDKKSEKKYTNLWIASAGAQTPATARQFTYGDQNDSQPRWSPDSRQIAFLSNRQDSEKPAQLFLIAIDGGEARPLSEIKGSIDEFAWAPDGKRLICAVRKSDPEELERQEDKQKKELGVVARHYDRVFYKLDGYGYLPKERTHLWNVDARTGKAKQLSDHPVYDEQNPAWSPDGKWIAFVSNRSQDPDFNIDEVDLFVMPSGGGEMQKIETPLGEKYQPSFSPDGQWIAYYASEGEALGYKNHGLWVVPSPWNEGQAPACNLTEPYDLHVSPAVINDMGSPEMMPPTWSKDGNQIYFPVTLHGSSLLKLIPAAGGEPQTVIDEGGTVGSFSFDRQQERLAYFYGTMSDPGQIFVRHMAEKRDYQITALNKTLLDSIDLGEVETVWIKGPDDNDLQGWIIKPPGFDPKKKYPSILEIHGGPLTQYGHFFMHEFYYLAAQGYVVHFSNPRGGRGYGEAHAKATFTHWGDPDYSDLMAWTDHIAGQAYIDPERMGVTGGSYGGFMTVWIIGHTDRFKAAVPQRCVSNMLSMWGSSDFNWAFQQVLDDKPPFEDLQKYWDQSPIKFIGNARTPTLVIHSENDLRCPIEQGEQVYVALKKLGVDSEMVRFPNEFHGLSRTGRTDRRIVRLNHILRWFDKYLK